LSLHGQHVISQRQVDCTAATDNQTTAIKEAHTHTDTKIALTQKLPKLKHGKHRLQKAQHKPEIIV